MNQFSIFDQVFQMVKVGFLFSNTISNLRGVYLKFLNMQELTPIYSTLILVQGTDPFLEKEGWKGRGFGPPLPDRL